MLRTREVPSLCQGGIPPRSDPQTQGGSSLGLEGLVPRGRSPRCPPCSSWYGVTKNPQPLSSTTYLRGEEVCLASRLGQIDVAEAN